MTTSTTFKSSAAGAAESISTGSVTSADGTSISYKQVGRGPALIILHGSMECGASHLQHAQALADSFTVYLPDRRGRGQSVPIGPHYGLATEVQDQAALLAKSCAQRVLGA